MRFRGTCFRLRRDESRSRLLMASLNLFVVENRDDVASLDVVAFTDTNLKKTTGRLGGDGGVVSFNSSTERNDTRRNGEAGKE